MANILLVDPADVARKALKGILARGGHRLACVGTAAEALDFIRANVLVDLVIVELVLEGEGGLDFVQRLQLDCFLKLMPLVIYTGTVDREKVHRAISLKVQNFLVKPYRDEIVFAELAKSLANPWRSRHFEEERSFCATMGYKPDELRRMLEQLRQALTDTRPLLLTATETRSGKETCDHLTDLASQAEAAGAWGLVDYTNELMELVKKGSWSMYVSALDLFDFASQMIFRHLEPNLLPEGYVTDDERQAKEDAKMRAFWFDAPAEHRLPVVTWPELQAQLDRLSGCPVIDTVAAGFQMAATGHPSSLTPIMDLAEKDPGLAAQLLIAVNALRHTEEDASSSVEDPRNAVSLLGEERLATMAKGLVTVEERRMHLPPFTWPQFWLFQVGVAAMARYICQFLEMPSLESRAHTAGMLHDIGKLLLVRLQPLGFHAIFDYARRERISLREAEQKFLGCTTTALAVYFAEKHGLPICDVNVMRWVDDPAQATADQDLVAIVAFARELCQRNTVGWNGDTIPATFPPLEDTPAWRVLAPQVFPGFNLKNFEASIRGKSVAFKHELNGRPATAVAAG